MKSSMKKKFDFSAEMNEAESIKATPKNEYLEEEKRLLDVNAKELASLNDNVHYMITNLENVVRNIHYMLYMSIIEFCIFCHGNKIETKSII